MSISIPGTYHTEMFLMKLTWLFTRLVSIIRPPHLHFWQLMSAYIITSMRTKRWLITFYVKNHEHFMSCSLQKMFTSYLIANNENNYLVQIDATCSCLNNVYCNIYMVIKHLLFRQGCPFCAPSKKYYLVNSLVVVQIY